MNRWTVYRRITITLFLLVIPPVVGLLLTYEVLKVDWASFMEHQDSYRPMEAPLPIPPDSVPIEGPAFIQGIGSPPNPVAADEVSLQRGQILYNIHCALCHGEAGDAVDTPMTEFLVEPAPADLTSETNRESSDGTMFLVITQGVPDTMPALRENLTIRERWDVVNYVRNLQGE